VNQPASGCRAVIVAVSIVVHAFRHLATMTAWSDVISLRLCRTTVYCSECDRHWMLIQRCTLNDASVLIYDRPCEPEVKA